MKQLFLLILLLLAAASFATWKHDVPPTGGVTVYWATDNNAIRDQQIALFQKWLAKTSPGTHITVKSDPMSAGDDSSLTKLIVQCVSGIGDDVLDLEGGKHVRYLNQMGVLKDVTDDAKRMGFGLDQTYASLVPELTVPDADGSPRQYAFPCNVASSLFFYNRETFRRYGLPMPPQSWTLEEFEQFGKRFVDVANPDPRNRQFFFIDSIQLPLLRRTLGQGEFNETDTRCILDRAPAIEALKLFYRWMNQLHLMPNLAETSSAATSAGLHGSAPQLFNSGNYAMFFSGRYMLIQFRQFNIVRAQHGQPPIDLATTQPPSGGFLNTDAITRCAGIYAGSKQQQPALKFLQFLASREYNEEVIRDGDSLPPNPEYAKSDLFLNPPDHHEEGPINKAFADSELNLAIGASYSPFVLEELVTTQDESAKQAYLNDRLTAEQAAGQVTDRLNAEIDRTLSENPAMQPMYDSLVQRQKQIDALRAAGKKVPLKWITDPFYRKYYVAQGWAEQ